LPITTARRSAWRVAAGTCGHRDLRQGSLRAQYRKCGKPNCHCALKGAQGYGPYWLLTWSDRDTGKYRGRTIPAGAIEGTRAQIAENQRVRGLVRDLVEVSDRMCDARPGCIGRDLPGPVQRAISSIAAIR